MKDNLNNMKCDELRLMAKDLGIKGYGSKGKGWLIPQIEAVLQKQEEEKKQAAKKANRKPRAVNLIEYNGKSQSLGAWAKELGMPIPTLRARFRSGWTIEQALSGERKTENLIEFNGKAQTLSAWARELGMPRATLNARLNILNWTPERALRKAVIVNA